MFVTFTCNPKWKEIKDNLYPGQIASDRPDLIARVFHLKLASLIDEITKKSIFGTVEAFAYTIEFQKRGLPHAHILAILDENHKIRDAEAIDKLVCQKFPTKLVSLCFLK